LNPGRKTFLVMRSRDEPLLAELSGRTIVLERRGWLPGDWLPAFLAGKRWPVISISLVRAG